MKSLSMLTLKLKTSLLFLALVASVAVTTPAKSESIGLPSGPQGPGGDDSIETAGGIRCRQSMNSNNAYLDVGVGSTEVSTGSTTSTDNQFIGYARIIMPLGNRPKRLDCSRLYNLELERMKLELEMMKMGLD